MKLKVVESYDTFDCDTCGTTWSDGLEVWLDGKKILNEPAHAHCLDPTHVDEGNILVALCKALGIEIEGLDSSYVNADLDYGDTEE